MLTRWSESLTDFAGVSLAKPFPHIGRESLVVADLALSYSLPGCSISVEQKKALLTLSKHVQASYFSSESREVLSAWSRSNGRHVARSLKQRNAKLGSAVVG